MSKWFKAGIGIAITVIALWWVLRDVPFAVVLEQIATGNPWLLLASVAVATSGFLIRALRWKVLLGTVKADTSLKSRFAGVSIGFMVNNVLPARVGELARAISFSRLEPVSVSAAFGTLVVERFMDGTVLLLLLIVPVFTPGFPAADALRSGAGLALLNFAVALVVGVLAVLVLLAVAPEMMRRAVARVVTVLPARVGRSVTGMVDGLLESFGIMRSPRLLLLGFGWSILFWLWHGLSFWLGMLAFDIDTGLISAFFTEAVVGFVVALPSAPGFLGTFHTGAQFALVNVYGVPDPQALAFAFAYHFGGWIPITAIGLWYAWSLGFSVGELGSSTDTSAPDAGTPTRNGVD